MIINSAEFQCSSPRADMCPQTDLPEYAFIGRSNVGKSSLINMLTGRNKLAMTSSTPGKTMLVNHFIINKEWYLVDLPGYGFAQRGKREMDKLWNLISHYVLEREQLTCLFVLIDIRHEPQQKDLDFFQFLGENGAFCHHLHEGRQDFEAENPKLGEGIPECAGRDVGRTATAFHHQCHFENGQGRCAELHRRNQQELVKVLSIALKNPVQTILQIKKYRIFRSIPW